MPPQQPSKEIIVKTILDEANLTFCETAERKDSAGERNLEGSAWDEGKMDGEFDLEDLSVFPDFSESVIILV